MKLKTVRTVLILLSLIVCAVLIVEGIGLEDIGEIISNGNILCLSCIGIG